MGYVERFWSLLCNYDRWLGLLLVANVALGTLLALSLPTLEPGSPSAALAVIDGVVILVTTGAVAIALWKCRQRRERTRLELDEISIRGDDGIDE